MPDPIYGLFSREFDDAQPLALNGVDAVRPPYPAANSVALVVPHSGQLAEVQIADILVPPQRQRRELDPVADSHLQASLAAYGLLQPIVLHDTTDHQLMLVAGWRRLEAARILHWPTIAAHIIAPTGGRTLAHLEATENLQRQNLNPLDHLDCVLAILAAEFGVEPASVAKLLRRWASMMYRGAGMTHLKLPEQAQLARLHELWPQLSATGWQSYAQNQLRLLSLPSVLRDAVASNQLTYNQAILLKAVPAADLTHHIEAAAPLSIKELRLRLRSQRSPRPAAAELPGPAAAISTSEPLILSVQQRQLAQLPPDQHRRALDLIAALRVLLPE